MGRRDGSRLTMSRSAKNRKIGKYKNSTVDIFFLSFVVFLAGFWIKNDENI